jgi:hypothetical protein
MKMDVRKLYWELVNAGIPVEGVSASEPLRIDFRKEATDADRKKAQQILAAHVPDTVGSRRRAAYLQQGITTDEMIVALWERVVEGRSESSDELQHLREVIKRRLSSSQDADV